MEPQIEEINQNSEEVTMDREEIEKIVKEVLAEQTGGPVVWGPRDVIYTSIGELASEDYYEILENGTKKADFTWEEAMEIEKKTNGKWRVPTIFEWDRLLEEFGKEGNELNERAFIEGLGLTEDEDGYGNYWSSTPNGGAYAFVLGFDSTSTIHRGDGTRRFGRSVRCVRVKEGEQCQIK